MHKNLEAPEGAAVLRERLGYIGEQQLFELLEIKPGTGRNRQSAGTLPPHYKVGRKKFYRVSEVEAWIRRNRVARAGACAIHAKAQ